MRTDQRRRAGAKPEPRGISAGNGEILFGRNAVAEALAGRRRHQRLIVAEGVRWDARMQQIRSRATTSGIPMDTVPKLMLDDTVGGSRHQGVLLLTSRYIYVELNVILESARPVLVLDHLQDPQNVGSLLRTAEVFGVTNVVLPHDRSAEITPAVVNASAGAVEHLQVAQ